MAKDDIVNAINDKLYLNGTVAKIKNIVSEVNRGNSKKIKLTNEGNLTVFQYMSYYKLDKLKELDKISNEVYITLKDLLDLRFKLQVKLGELAYAALEDKNVNQTELSIVREKVNDIEKKLNKYHLLFGNDEEEYIQQYILYQMSNETYDYNLDDTKKK